MGKITHLPRLDAFEHLSVIVAVKGGEPTEEDVYDNADRPLVDLPRGMGRK